MMEPILPSHIQLHHQPRLLQRKPRTTGQNKIEEIRKASKKHAETRGSHQSLAFQSGQGFVSVFGGPLTKSTGILGLGCWSTIQSESTSIGVPSKKSAKWSKDGLSMKSTAASGSIMSSARSQVGNLGDIRCKVEHAWREDGEEKMARKEESRETSNPSP